jgi:hypothetical protein
MDRFQIGIGPDSQVSRNHTLVKVDCPLEELIDIKQHGFIVEFRPHTNNLQSNQPQDIVVKGAVESGHFVN